MLTERHIFERAMWNEEFCQNCGQQADAEIHQMRDVTIGPEDERVKELLSWVDAQIAGIKRSSLVEASRGALNALEQIRPRLLGLLPVQPAQEEDDGWVTFGLIKEDVENETRTFERVPVQPAASTPTAETNMKIQECLSCAVCELSVFETCKECDAGFCMNHYITHMENAHDRKMHERK